MPSNQKHHQWARVSRSAPCPICGNSTYCTVAAKAGYVHCMRIESDQIASGRLGGWIHRLAGAVVRDYAKLETKEKKAFDYPKFVRARKATTQEDYERIAIQLGVALAGVEKLWPAVMGDVVVWPQRNSIGTIVGASVHGATGKWYMPGSEPGLHYECLGIRQRGPVHIVEGASDTACLIGLGYQAIGRPSCSGGFGLIKSLLTNHQGPIIVWGERDYRTVQDERHDPKTCDCCPRCWPGLYWARQFAGLLTAKLRLPPVGYKDVRQMMQYERGLRWIALDTSSKV